MYQSTREKLWLSKEEYTKKVNEANKLMGYLCMYMYMLYCDADSLMKWIKKENSMMDPLYIGSKIGYFFRAIKNNFTSVDEFMEIASREIRAGSIKKHLDVWLWITDYCFQNYPAKLQEYIKSNPEIMSMFPEDIRDENWHII